MALDFRTSELEHNFMKEHISSTEKHLADISSKLSHYIKKLASVRDSGDMVAKSFSSFASKETCNQTLRLALGEFSDVLYSVQEYRDVEVTRFDVRVIGGLKSYHQLCTDAKNEINKCFDARQKELKKKKELEKARSKNSPNWQKIAQAEKEVNQAQEEATRITQAMKKLVEQFERRKLEDLKNIFLELVKIEMIFHSKAIELYTKSYNILKEINVEDDLHEFLSHIKTHSSTLDSDALSPTRHNTVPKTADESMDSSSYLSFRPQISSGMQGTPRSVFTLKATVPKDVNSSTVDDYVESKEQ